MSRTALLALAERDLVVLGVSLDDVAGLPLAGEDLLGERILEEALDRAAERAGAERRSRSPPARGACAPPRSA